MTNYQIEILKKGICPFCNELLVIFDLKGDKTCENKKCKGSKITLTIDNSFYIALNLPKDKSLQNKILLNELNKTWNN